MIKTHFQRLPELAALNYCLAYNISHMDNDVLAYRVLLEKRKENAPFWEKKVLTVEEAAEYTGIGRTKIRQIIMKGDCPFAVTNGVQVCVIRDKFIDYLDKQFRI